MADGKIFELKEILLRTQSPDGSVRKAGEAQLLELENQGEYALLLVRLIEMHCGADGALANDRAFRTLAAIMFKNLVRKRWQPDSDADSEKILPLPEASKDNIKNNIVHMMCVTPPEVQRQLSEALSIISKHDFPAKWPAVVPELVSRMGSKEQGTVLGTLLTANSILKRYRYVFKSDKLYIELKYVLEQMQEPLLQIFKQIGEALRACGSMDVLMLSLLEMLRLCCRIFFSLNWQDLPEFFEDHMSEWMDEFNRYLSFGSDLATEKDKTFTGAIEKLQAAVVENLNLYADKYEEEFQPHLGPFSQAVWVLLTKNLVGDLLATTCIRFLTSVVSKKMHEQLFRDPSTLKQIVENIVVPNLILTTEEEELFEDNPMDYISRDMEGSDSDTRRRAASDLIKGMCKHYLETTTNICKQCIELQIHQYESNMKQNWKVKDTAIKLLLAVSIRSQNANGVSEVNPHINVMEIGATKLLPEIKDAEGNSHPIILADCIKFVTTLRNQFTKEQWLYILPLLMAHFTSSHVVVATYAAISIERVLIVQLPAESIAVGSSQTHRSKRVSLLEPSDLQPFLQGMFSGLFGVLDNPELPENAYVMKAIMRCLAAAGKSVVLPVASDVLSKQCVYLAQVSRNPSNPLFNHYLFESIAVLVRSVCSSGNLAIIDMFEAGLFPPFQNVLAQDVVEFIPYVFQILAQLLELRPGKQGFTAAYTALFPPLLSPPLWERKGNIPALSRLIRAYYVRNATALAQANHLNATFGVFQKLLSSRSTETQAYQLLESLCISFCPLDPLAPYLQEVFRLLIVQLMERSENVRLNRSFSRFICVFALKHGAAALESLLERCRPGMTVVLLDQVIVKLFEGGNKPVLSMQERSLFTCGFVVLMGLSSVESDLSRWKRLLRAMMTIVIPEGDESIVNGEFEPDEDVPEAIAYDATYSKLHFATNQTTTQDLLSRLSVNSDPKAFLVQKLRTYQQALGPGKFCSSLQEALTPEQLSMLQLLFHECGANLQ